MSIDALTFIGPWPFRRLKIRSADELVKELDRLGLDKALVSNYQGVFYKDSLIAAEELMEEIHPYRERLIPVPSLNPSIYGWEADLVDIVNMGVPGIRLIPGYHGYTLEDKLLSNFLQLVKENNLFLQVLARIEDERQHHWLTHVGQVSLRSLQDLVYGNKDIPFIISGLRYLEIVTFLRELPEDSQTLADISWIKGQVLPIDELIDMGLGKRLVLGTGQSFHYGDSALLMVERLEDNTQKEDILKNNMERLFPGLF